MNTNIRITSVDFDTDGDEKLAKELSSQVIGQVYTIVHESDEDPFDLLADAVSDNTGWCVFSCNGVKCS